MFYVLLSTTYAQTVDAGLVSTSTTSSSSSAPTTSVKTSTTVSQPTTSSSTKTNYSAEQAPYPGCVQQLYKISGYYSPKPVQDIYTRDTYEAEIRLNGRGTHGASGAPVFNGMVAAPKNYAFGTVIILPGLGIWQVKDRWWAIVASDGYDRIDVWVGEWDEGIHRAKSIGLRWVVGRYCPESVTDQIGFNWDVIPHYRNFTQVAFWSIDQNIGRSWPLVSLAQDYLRKIGYLSTDTIPGIYNQQMRELVCRFQIDQLWLGGSEDYCGVLGPMTRAKLKSLLIKAGIVSDSTIYTLDNVARISSLFTQANVRPAWNYEAEPVVVNTTAPVAIVNTNEDEAPTSQTNVVNLNAMSTRFDRAISIGESSDTVVVLQKVLTREKLFDHKVTWYFWPITEAAVTAFQIKYGLIDSASHVAAWHLWPATRALLTKKQILLRLKPLDRAMVN